MNPSNPTDLLSLGSVSAAGECISIFASCVSVCLNFSSVALLPHVNMNGDHGSCPGYADHAANVDGIINVNQPVTLSHFQHPFGEYHASRSDILRSIVSIGSQEYSTVELKMDSMTKLVGKMAQLLLLGESGTGSPLSWVTSSSTHSDVVANGLSSAASQRTTIQTSQSATGLAHSADKQFKCPVCPRHMKTPLTEKGFYKHVMAWKGLSGASATGKKKKKSSCPGISHHPKFNRASGVEGVINHTLSLLTPGANAAHGEGTGNHHKVDAYFAQLFPNS
jgi:hypothetical protein